MPEPPSLADRLAFLALVVIVGVALGLTLVNLNPFPGLAGGRGVAACCAAVALVASWALWRSYR